MSSNTNYNPCECDVKSRTEIKQKDRKEPERKYAFLTYPEYAIF